MRNSKKLSEYSELMQEWDTDKNKGLDPGCITYGSKRPVWWKCCEGHEWKASVYNRVHHHSGCPYCAGQRVIPGENDLLSQFPEVAKMWSPNNKISADQVCAKTMRKYLWVCDKGHEWKAAVAGCVHGSGCPYCEHKRVIPGETDLESIFPEISLQWDYTVNGDLKPRDVFPHSHRIVGWRCDKGHTWKERIDNRIKYKECPICSGKRIISGINDFVTLFPNIAKEWDYEKNQGVLPEKMAPHSGKSAWWKCERGHSWKTTIDSRTLKGTRCPYCYGNKIVVGENDLATLYPELASEWDYERNKKTPQQVRAKSQEKAWWKCKKGHRWEAYVYQRVLGETGCPYCSKKRLVPGENDLETLLPDIAKTWDYENNNGKTPRDVTANSKYYAAWVCEKGHRWKSRVVARTNCTRSGCPYCEHKRPILGETDLRSHNPELLEEWNYERNQYPPEHYSYGSIAKVWWRCKYGHEWRTVIQHRTRGTNCPICHREGR